MTFYLALGAGFGVIAGITLKRRLFWPLVLSIVGTTIVGLGGGLWQDQRTNDPDIGLTMLLFLGAPIITGALLLGVGWKDAQRGEASLSPTITLVMIVWILAYLLLGLVAVATNLVTF